jgi:hypothetical protein
MSQISVGYLQLEDNNAEPNGDAATAAFVA